MVNLAGELSKSRKKREIPASLASEAAVASYKEKSSHSGGRVCVRVCMYVDANLPPPVPPLPTASHILSATSCHG